MRIIKPKTDTLFLAVGKYTRVFTIDLKGTFKGWCHRALRVVFIWVRQDAWVVFICPCKLLTQSHKHVHRGHAYTYLDRTHACTSLHTQNYIRLTRTQTHIQTPKHIHITLPGPGCTQICSCFKCRLRSRRLGCCKSPSPAPTGRTRRQACIHRV